MRPTRMLSSTRLQRSFVFSRFGDLATGGFTIASLGNGSGSANTSDGLILNSGTNTTSNVSYHSYSYQFMLQNLPSFTEFTNLFDQYKVLSVRIRFIPFQTTSISDLNTTNQCLSLIHSSVIDYDDSVLFASSNAGLQEMRQYESFREKNLFRPSGQFVRKIRPHVSVPVYKSGVSSAYSNVPARWIDCNYTDVEHYGFKGMFQVFAPSSSIAYFVWIRPEIKVTLAFRNVR